MTFFLAGEYPRTSGLGPCQQLDSGEGAEDQEVHAVAEAGAGLPRPLAPAPDTEGGVTVWGHDTRDADQGGPGEASLHTCNILEVRIPFHI